MKANKLQITSVRIERVTDEYGDGSNLGKYSNNASGDLDIVRVGEHAGTFLVDLPVDAEVPGLGREYRFFLPNVENYAGCTKAEVREYCRQDYARMESLNNGNWYFIGIIAKAEIWNPASQVCQTVRSGGLWGIESDSGDYLDEVAKEELSGLKSELEAMGIGDRAIARAFKNVETVNK